MGNHCAKYEHLWSKHEGEVFDASRKTDFFFIKCDLRVRLGALNSLLASTHVGNHCAKYKGVRAAATDGRTGPITIDFIIMGFGRLIRIIDISNTLIMF